MKRDMSQKQYLAAMERHGFIRDPGMGYWQLPIANKEILVSDWNAGSNRRTKLAYMLRELKRNEEAKS